MSAEGTGVEEKGLTTASRACIVERGVQAGSKPKSRVVSSRRAKVGNQVAGRPESVHEVAGLGREDRIIGRRVTGIEAGGVTVIAGRVELFTAGGVRNRPRVVLGAT